MDAERKIQEVRKRVPRERADERVWQLAYERAVGLLTPERFVQLVNIVDMRPARFPEDVLDDGYIPGTLDIISGMLMDGVITDAEYEAIAQERDL